MLEVLISTINSGIYKIPNVLLPPMRGVSYLVVHQIEDNNDYSAPEELHRMDVRIVTTTGKGLTKSRNIALKNATGDICLIADDDVRYRDEYFRKIISTYRKFNPDIGLFMINTENDKEYKKYPQKPKTIRIGDHYSVSSIEISFNRKSVLKSGVLFDERFGLGTWLNGGGERFFIHDALKKGLLIQFFSEFIVNHPYESTIKSFPPYHKRRVRQTGAVDARINGHLALLKIPFAVLKEYKRLKQNNKSLFTYAKQRYQGAMHILTNEPNP